METSVMNKIASVVFGFMLFVCAPLAQAGMLSLTFDEDYLQFDGSTADASILNSSPSYGGFKWDEKFSLVSVDKKGFSETETFGSRFLSNSSYGPIFYITRATPFDFLSVAFGKAGGKTAQVVQFWGYDEFGTEIASTNPFLLNGQGLTVIKPSLAGIHKLKMKTGGGWFAMDHFEFEDTTVKVTEAGSLALLVIGLIGLWAARRRGQLQA